MKTNRAVQLVLLHLHLDEVMAYFLAYTFGDDVFLGIKTAKVQFTSEVKRQSLAQWIASKTLSLGAGGDIDEHLSGEAARIEGKSACVLMAEQLTLQGNPIWDMVREVNRFDGTIGCPKSHLASLLKATKVSMGDNFDQAALRWSMKIMTAVYAKLAGNLGPSKNEKPFVQFATTVIKKNSFSDPDAVAGLKRLIEVEGKHNNGIFSLRHVYECLWRTADSDDARADVGEHILFAIRILYQDQTKYHTFTRYLKSLNERARKDVWFTVDVRSGSDLTVVNAAIVRTDNPQAHTVLRSMGAVISIVMNDGGNVTIQGDKRYPKSEWLRQALDTGVTQLCAMNRYADMTPDARKRAVWPVLQSRGNCPGDAYWYLAEEGWLAMFNGTHNHKTPPTKLALVQLRRNATNAFDPTHVEGWKDFMRVPEVNTRQGLDSGKHQGLNGLGKVFDNALKC